MRCWLARAAAVEARHVQRASSPAGRERSALQVRAPARAGGVNRPTFRYMTRSRQWTGVERAVGARRGMRPRGACRVCHAACQLPRLEAEAQLHDVRVRHGGEQVSLGAHVVRVVSLQNALLLHDLGRARRHRELSAQLAQGRSGGRRRRPLRGLVRALCGRARQWAARGGLLRCPSRLMSRGRLGRAARG
jgi:hypothetical protein